MTTDNIPLTDNETAFALFWYDFHRFIHPERTIPPLQHQKVHLPSGCHHYPSLCRQFHLAIAAPEDIKNINCCLLLRVCQNIDLYVQCLVHSLFPDRYIAGHFTGPFRLNNREIENHFHALSLSLRRSQLVMSRDTPEQMAVNALLLVLSDFPHDVWHRVLVCLAPQLAQECEAYLLAMFSSTDSTKRTRLVRLFSHLVHYVDRLILQDAKDV